MSSILVVIPARWGSTRFPGKPLHPICGKPLLQHVWECSSQAETVDKVVIATDDERIACAAKAFGAEVAMTPTDVDTGTDRIALVAKNYSEHEIVINVQGDEPLIAASLIDRLGRTLREQSEIEMATAASPFREAEAVACPDNVKVVVDQNSRALYFSRSIIPFDRDMPGPQIEKGFLHHLGIYAYRRNFLLQFVKWTPTFLEEREKLEQLRALEHGVKIVVLKTDHRSPGVDRPEDVRLVESLLEKE
ncbi:MAG: 3-deoxy-manno-octulosonate cytidylyltransferase [Chthoniobacterales bacterium]